MTDGKHPFPELVEGSSFLFNNIKYQVQPFDKFRELIHLAAKFSAFPHDMFMLSSVNEPIRETNPTTQVAARGCGLVRLSLVGDRRLCDVRTPRLQ